MSRALIVVGLLLCAVPARAHKPSDSYLSVRPGHAGLDVRWDIALRDLEQAIGLDADQDGAITWGEVRERQDAIAAYAQSRLQVDADGAACTPGGATLRIDHHTDGAYAVLDYAFACAAAPRQLALRYGLFFDFDAQHRGLLRVVEAGGTRVLLFSADQPTQRIELGAGGGWQSVREFWRSGVWHIWSGTDHLLFLLALLLPAVLRRDARGWHPVGLRPALAATVKVVTAFTLAHSITLSLAAVGAVHAPARWIETGIAASVVLAALNNAYPIFRDGRWLVGFGFGLLHGFGFASVLAAPEVQVGSLLSALLGFNAGVETGQLAVVAAFVPLAFLARRSWFYQRLTLVAGSWLIAAVATVWMLQRAFDLSL
ncbi:MAG: HupE/UreJ family protein [Deltaproteobacteria bacterium]|nr:HupE/UreJ family protein [Deltaproteobacteria bacterium]